MANVALLHAPGGSAFDTRSVLRDAGVTPAGFDHPELLSRALQRGHFEAIVFEIGDRDADWRARLENVRSQLQPATWLLAVGPGRELTVAALEAGADEYLHHPLDADLVRSRLAAALRRLHKLFSRQRTLSCGPYLLDMPSHTLRFGTASAVLTPRETDLLAMFFDNPGKTIPRVDLAHRSGMCATATSHAIEQQMYQLRRTLRRAAPGLVLRSAYGRGYVLQVAERHDSGTPGAQTKPPGTMDSPIGSM